MRAAQLTTLPPAAQSEFRAAAHLDSDRLHIPLPSYVALCQRHGPPPIAAPLSPHGPRLDALLTDYAAALRPYVLSGIPILPLEDFITRLELCRHCPLQAWSEDLQDGYGRCESLLRPCSRILLWSPHTRCILPAPSQQW